ncbi:conserved hypothetical protein [Oleispira antarctica RB-8]|uniref:DUF423 domain-containing protein n=1 Tax=Oleispira antarctica RB-8 TaxID=698738 RepID=R4YRN0_OLEAN|nr:conserved hypothetical protein [Oleispira antarctica RB-8]|tara:strand:- start:5984 stop:6403 length:420 start_codon:yes stop_codon:yes gene_type:complete
MLSARFYLLVSAISGLLSVALGAFGAHGLKKVVSPDMLTVYQTGVQYQFIHSLALLALAILMLTSVAKPAVMNKLKWSANLMMIGILLFSGSLYTMTFMSAAGGFPAWLGPITPIGGLAFIMGWIFLMVAAFKLPIDEQ